MATGRFKQLHEVNPAEDLKWVTGVAGDDYQFHAVTLEIDAPIDVVWGCVQELNNYHHFSNGAIAINMDDELAVNNTIHLQLYPGTLKGFFIPSSTEMINVFDEERHVLGWTRQLPCSDLRSQRYHVLEESADHLTTRSSIALRIPGNVGFFTRKLMGASIEHAFNEINNGIKLQAEAACVRKF